MISDWYFFVDVSLYMADGVADKHWFELKFDPYLPTNQSNNIAMIHNLSELIQVLSLVQVTLKVVKLLMDITDKSKCKK